MLPGWDRLQDLRGGKYPAKKEPETVKDEATARAVHGVTDQNTINLNAERISAYAAGVKEGKKMSLLGKLKHLTEEAQSFNDETEASLDGISEKIAAGRIKRAEAEAKHHAYYDAIIAGVDESVKVIDRLSNGPLHEDGKG